MRKFAVLCLLVFSSVAAAWPSDWDIDNFEISTLSFKKAFTSMKRGRDAYLAEVEQAVPNFVAAYPTEVKKQAELLFRSFQGPILISATGVSSYSSQILYYAREIADFALRGGFEEVAPDFEQQADAPYRYCAAHPNEPGVCEQAASFRGLRHTVLRRMIANPEFVTEMCSDLSPIIQWHLKWNNSNAASRDVFDQFVEETDRVLQFFYADGTWTTMRLDQIQTTLDKRVVSFILRRYLDGGPKFIEAARACLSKIDTDYRDSARYPSTASSNLEIDQILKFKNVATSSGATLDIQTVEITWDVGYRLTHGYSWDQPLPSPMLTPAEIQRGVGRYAELGKEGVPALLARLNLSDRHNVYRQVAVTEANDPKVLELHPNYDPDNSILIVRERK